MMIDQFNRLEQIYNTFLLVETKGNSTMIMGQALKALKMFIDGLAAEVKSPQVLQEEKE